MCPIHTLPNGSNCATRLDAVRLDMSASMLAVPARGHLAYFTCQYTSELLILPLH